MLNCRHHNISVSLKYNHIYWLSKYMQKLYGKIVFLYYEFQPRDGLSVTYNVELINK